MAHVFISYKHEDGDFAEILKDKLEKKGLEAWMDSDIQGGEKWSPAIDTAIENSFALVVIMSPEARKSEYITYEWAVARGLGKAIVPILLKVTDLHPKLAEFQYIDFTNRNARPWDNLTARLKTLAKATQVSVTPNQRQKQSDPIRTPKTRTSVKATSIVRLPIKHQKHPKLTKTIEELLKDVEEFMLSLGSEVHLEGLKFYVACKRIDNFGTIITKAKSITINLKLNPDDVTLESGFSRDVRKIGHRGTGNVEIVLRNKADLEKAKPLIIKSYELS